MKFTKHTIYIGLFAILYLIVAFSSFWHACAFFGLANNSWMSIILAFAFEVGQAAVLFSLLTSAKDRNRIMPWVLMTMFTLVQVIGNVYSSYKYIINNSVENLRYFKEPIFIWTDLPDAQANVIIVYLVGAILPVAALLLTSMITNYLTDQSEESNESIKFTEINSDKGPDKPPIEIHNKEEFDKVYNDENPLINQNSMLHMENQGLQESNKKKDEEIEQLRKQIEELNNKKDGESGEITTEESKSNNDNGGQQMGTDEDQTTTESLSENTETTTIKNNGASNSGNNEQGIGQTETELEGNKSRDGEDDIKSQNIKGEDMNDTSGYLIGEKGDDGSKILKPSHFINL